MGRGSAIEATTARIELSLAIMIRTNAGRPENKVHGYTFLASYISVWLSILRDLVLCLAPRSEKLTFLSRDPHHSRSFAISEDLFAGFGSSD